MKIGEAFPSSFLKVDDLQGRDVTVTIASVELETIGKDDKEQKLVLGLLGKTKKLVCNKTNAKTIAGLHGEETDEWVGKQIILSPREVEFQGKMVMAIRVSLKRPGAAPVQASSSKKAPVQQQEVPPADAADAEDVPF